MRRLLAVLSAWGSLGGRLDVSFIAGGILEVCGQRRRRQRWRAADLGGGVPGGDGQTDGRTDSPWAGGVQSGSPGAGRCRSGRWPWAESGASGGASHPGSCAPGKT